MSAFDHVDVEAVAEWTRIICRELFEPPEPAAPEAPPPTLEDALDALRRATVCLARLDEQTAEAAIAVGDATEALYAINEPVVAVAQ